MSPSIEPVTIFHLDDERGFRGGERQLLYVASAMRADGHANVICCRGGSPLEHEARAHGFEVLVLPYAFEFDIVSARRLAKAARHRHRPVVHAHTGHTVGVATLCRLLGGPPAVAHRRGASRLRRGAGRWLKYDRVARVIAVSRAVEQLLLRGGLAAERIAVVPDCVPASAGEWRAAGYESPRFAPASAERRAAARRALADANGVDADATWVGNLAALVPLKDHATLVAAAAAVLQTRPNTVFLIAGEGPERERLQADIQRRGLSGRVVLLGHFDAAELFSAIDLFVLSSSREGMGSVLLEAAACGVPVAATAVGGIPDVVRNGYTGLLVPPRDSEALAAAIVGLIEQPGLASRLATAASDALPLFSLARTVHRMEAIYAAALASVTTPPAVPTIGDGAPWRGAPQTSTTPSFATRQDDSRAKRVARRVRRALQVAASVAVTSVIVASVTSPLWTARAPSTTSTARPAERRLLPATNRPAQRPIDSSASGLTFGESFTGISDSDLILLAREMKSVESIPSVEPYELIGDPSGLWLPPVRARNVRSAHGS